MHVAAPRARSLAAVLADAGIQAVITSRLLRTRETARPIAERMSIALEIVAVRRAAREYAKAVADAVREHRGPVELVVGHNNTVNLINEQLGGPKLADLCDSVRAKLFIVQLEEGKLARLVRTGYGARLAQQSAECPGMSP